MFPAPALPRTTLNVPLSCPPVHAVVVSAPAEVEATVTAAARRVRTNVRRRAMTVLRHRSAAPSQVLVIERGVAEAPVGVPREVGHRAEPSPAEAAVQPIGSPLGDRVQDEKRLPVDPRLVLELLHQRPPYSATAGASVHEQLRDVGAVL